MNIAHLISTLILMCAWSLTPAHKSNPQLAQMYLDRGRLSLEQDHWQDASFWFRKSIKADNRSLSAHQGYQLVEDHYFEHTKKIRQEYQRLAEQYPNNPLFLFLLGCVSPDRQTELMNRAHLQDSTFAPPYLYLLREYLSQPNNTSARSLLDLALRNCPENPYIWAVKFSYDVQSNDTKEIKRTFDVMSSRFPKFYGTAGAYLIMAKEQSDVDQRARLLQGALSADTLGGFAVQAFQQLYEIFAQKDSTKAEEFAWLMTTFRPRASFDPAIGIDKRLPVYAYQALWNFYVHRDTAKAIALAEEVLKSPSSTYFLLQILGANKALQEISPRLSVQLLRRAESLITPERVWGLHCLGQPSRSAFATLAPKIKNTVQTDLGWAYYKAGRYAEALEVLRSASGKVSRNEPKIWSRLGQTYEKLGKPRQAVAAYVQSLSFQEDPEVRALLSQVSSSISSLPIALSHRHFANVDAAIADAQTHRNLKSLDFLCRLQDGSSVSLKTLKGKIIILDFWATWCGPCIAELPHLQQLYEEFKDDNGIFIVALSTENSQQLVADFIRKNNYSFPVGFAGGATSKFDVDGIPTTILLDTNGFIRYRHIGYDGSLDFVAMMRKEIQIVRSSSSH